MSRKQKKNLIRIIFSLVLFIILFIVDKSISLDKLIGGNFGFLLPLSLYLVLPVYKEEVRYKLQHGYDDFIEKFNKEFSSNTAEGWVVDINRKI